jgi:Holliday junction resolvasome RuvABC DNA-binding subunit
MVKTVSHVVTALYNLGYTLEEIQVIRKEIQRQFDDYEPEEVEHQATLKKAEKQRFIEM